MEKGTHTEAVTLDQLLESREDRARRQQALLEAHPGQTLLCLTVQLPGSVKRNALSLAIARAGVEALEAAFAHAAVQERDLVTGFEAYCLVPLLPLEAKRLCCNIEDRHPLGRLMDVDVLEMAGRDTAVPVPVSRGRIGLPPRQCLLCGRPARECIRQRSHSPEQLLAKIEQMVKDYNV